MTLAIKKIPGQMPDVWDRSVIFFANILSLFFGNHTETDVLREEVGALESYGARLVPIVNLLFKGTDNLLILEKELDPELPNYFRKKLGLTLPKIQVMSHSTYAAIPEDKGEKSNEIKKLLKNLSNHRARWVDGYVTDETLVRLAELVGKETMSSFAGSRRGNNKYLLYEYLVTRSLPVFDTYVVKTDGEITRAFRKLRDQGYTTAVAKAEIGASGIGMKKVSLEGDIESIKLPEYLFFEGSCLIQGWLDASVKGVTYIGSPSVQIFLDDRACSLHDITEQILSKDSVHEGNVAPPAYLANSKEIGEEMLNQAGEIGKWLHEQGYRGTASADFHLVKRNQRIEVRICEVNARVTGATYPSMLAHHFLPGAAWLMRNIRFSPPITGKKLLKDLEEADLLYLPQKEEGILPFNFNPNEQGEVVKGQFLFLGKTTDDAYRLVNDMSAVETIKGIYDRD